jgi:hypothetical protein
MRRAAFAVEVAAIGLASVMGAVGAVAQEQEKFQFSPNSLVVTRSVYTGTADTVKIGEVLPPGCPAGPNGSYVINVPTTTAGVTTPVTVTCGVASDNGEAPTTKTRITSGTTQTPTAVLEFRRRSFSTA